MKQNEMNTQNTLSGVQPNAGANVDTTMPVAPVESVASATTDESPKTSKKKSPGMLIALVLCALLACGGVGFGIWAMISNNTEVGRLNEQIASLQSQNASLVEHITEQNARIEDLSGDEVFPAPAAWANTEVADGVFRVLDEDGHVIAQSDTDGPAINEILACEASAENTILKCTVSTSEGEGWFLYDAYGHSLTSSFYSY